MGGERRRDGWKGGRGGKGKGRGRGQGVAGPPFCKFLDPPLATVGEMTDAGDFIISPTLW